MVQPTAIDLFAGAGGATQGLVDAGYRVLAAVENEADPAGSYRLNHPSVRLWEEDIRKVPAAKMRRELNIPVGELDLLKGCPPCQGFSSLADGRAEIDELRNDLVGVMLRFAREFMPRAVLVENVPGLGRDRRSAKLRFDLEELGYAVKEYIVDAQTFGVPQRRRRYLMVALRGRRNRSRLPDEMSGVGLDGEAAPSVRTAFDQLAEIDLAEDPLSTHGHMSSTVARRVAAVPVGGTRFDLPAELQLACHQTLDQKGRSATASYGRMKWDEPSPTMTTRCTTPACGSFIHPDEDRPITLREAALLQTFPAGYSFVGGRSSIERQIGNAVPVRMAAAIATSILEMTSAV